MIDGKRLYIVVGLCAVVVYLGALWNHFAFDDTAVILNNPLVQSWSGVWEAFVRPYWPVELGAKLYRPLATATFAIDWHLGGAAWFHAINLLWHAGASVAVAGLAKRWVGTSAALISGLLFAVHPMHVEAVAYVVGRAELMGGVFALLAVYAAVERASVLWSAAAFVLAVLSKENAAVAPALIVWAWVVGIRPVPSHRRVAAFVASWILVAVLYAAVRWTVLQDYTQGGGLAPVFVGQSPVAVRLTAVAALADVARLLVFPLALRADYSPGERTIVTSIGDPRFLAGLVVLAVWVALLVLAWRRRRRVEAFALGWIAIAYLPVANLLFPIGILIAERTLYLPSAGLALAVGAAAARLPARRLVPVAAVVLAAAAVRTALRVPVWRDDTAVTLSILDDSPRSYFGMARVAVRFQEARQPVRALEIYQQAIREYDRSAMLLVAASDAALATGNSTLADSLLQRAGRLCGRCEGEFRFEEAVARWRGDSAVADSLVARAKSLEIP